MASNTNNILFGNGAIAIAQQSHIHREFSFYTHPITHTHIISSAEPHLLNSDKKLFLLNFSQPVVVVYAACAGLVLGTVFT